MVIRGGKDVITVEIYKENYEFYKQKAEDKRFTIKELINDLLENQIEKEKFLQRIAPSLSIESIEQNRMTLKDSNKREFIDVFLKNSKLECSKDNSTDCVHCHFVWAIPEFAKLNLKKQQSNLKNY